MRVLLAVFVMGVFVARAHADAPRRIGPGHEAEVLAMARASLDPQTFGRSSIAIGKDAFTLELGGASARLVVFHPSVGVLDESFLAPGIQLRCGPREAERACRPEERETFRAPARALDRARTRHAADLWTVEESPAASDPARGRGPSQPVDRLAAAAALLAIVSGYARRAQLARRGVEPATEGPSRREIAALVVVLAAFVALTVRFTSLLPLHEHASFVARSDCAVDDRCVRDPVGGWGPTSFHVLGAVLARVPGHVAWLSYVSLAFSVVYVALAWAFTRRLLVALGARTSAPVGALVAAASLATHPVFWRLSGSGDFWPYVLVCLLLSGCVALDAARTDDRLAASLGGFGATLLLALVCGGNYVLLSLAPLLVLTPLAWAGRPIARTDRIVAAGRAIVYAAAFAAVVADDAVAATEHMRATAVPRAPSLALAMLRWLDPLMLDARVSPRLWAPLLVGSVGWFVPVLRRRVLAGDPPGSARSSVVLALPVLYAGLVPALPLGTVAGEILGVGYPVGFLQHHWEFAISSVAVGLGAAFVAALAERPFPRLGSHSVPTAFALGALGLATAPFAHEGVRMATGRWVVERELAALDRSFGRLPTHDLLLVAPRVLAPIDRCPPHGDPIEVHFPRGAYAYALRERGLAPGTVMEIDRVDSLDPVVLASAKTLVYVGSSLRSFQPCEIRRGLPSTGERPELARLRERFDLVPAVEFALSTAQHPAISLRLGGDRTDRVRLGFYRLVPRAPTGAPGRTPDDLPVDAP